MEKIIIDLNMTYASITYLSSKGIDTIKNKYGSKITQCVALISEDGNIADYEESDNGLISNSVIINDFMKYIGTSKKYEAGKYSYMVQEILSYIIKSLKKDAESYLNRYIDTVLISIPWYFTDTKCKVVKHCAEINGLRVEEIIKNSELKDMLISYDPAIESNYEIMIQRFIESIKNLYEDFYKRIDINKWREALDSEVIYYVGGDKRLLSDKILEFLVSNHYIPKEVWKLLDDHFNWNVQYEYISKKFSKGFADYIYKQINDETLRYDFFNNGEVFEYDAFLEYRENAYNKLLIKDISLAEEFINKAEEIYDKDPDIYMMKGICAYYKKDNIKARGIFEELLEKDDRYVYPRFYRARILYENKEIYSALEDCKLLYEQQFAIDDFLLFYAKCCFSAQRMEEARKLLIKIKNKDNEASNLLMQVNKEIARKIKENPSVDNKTKSYLNTLYKEIGILNPSELKKKIRIKVLESVIVCLMIFIMQIVVTNIEMKDIGLNKMMSLKDFKGYITYLKQDYTVNSDEDIEKLSLEVSPVKGTLTKAVYTGLNRISIKDKNGDIKNIYLTPKEAKEKGVFKDSNGYVCVGEVSNKKVIIITDYEQAMQAYNNKTIDYKGIINSNVDENLVNQIKDKYGEEKFRDEFLTDSIINSKINPLKFANIIVLDIVTFVLQIILIISTVYSVLKMKEKNDKKLYS